MEGEKEETQPTAGDIRKQSEEGREGAAEEWWRNSLACSFFPPTYPPPTCLPIG